MKGVIFTEFLEMVEEKFSPEVADKIINSATLSTEGAYTSVGTYHHGELIELIQNLSDETDIDIPELVKTFGFYLFNRFVSLYPDFFNADQSTFTFLELIENHVHVEVKKLYPDAELPTFKTRYIDPDTLEMIYQSRRPFAPLARGLMQGCIDHFQEQIEIDSTDLSDGQNKHVQFVLTRTA